MKWKNILINNNIFFFKKMRTTNKYFNQQDEFTINKKRFYYIFTYNSKYQTSLDKSGGISNGNIFLNQYSINLGSEFTAKELSVCLDDLQLLISVTPSNHNSFNFIPKAIYIKFENVIDQDSDYLNSDGYFFDGILNLNSQYNFEYNHEIENTFQYILNSPLKRKIKQSKIIISFWCYDDRNFNDGSLNDGSTTQGDLLILYQDILKNYQGSIPIGLNGLNLLGCLKNPTIDTIGNITMPSPYNYCNTINMNGELKISYKI